MNMQESDINLGRVLMLRQLEGSLNAHEELQLQELIQANETLRQEWESTQLVWQRTEPLSEDQDFNPNSLAAWEKIKSRVEEKAKNRPRTRKMYPWLAAASVVLFAAVGAWVFWPESTKAPLLVMVQSGAGRLTHQLPDGSTVALEANSYLEYSLFDTQSRTLKLNGTGFFDVIKDSKRPFVVNTHKSQVSVLGTSFLVKADSVASELSVAVLTGKVKVDYTQVSGKKVSTLLTAGRRQWVQLSTGEFRKDSFEVSALRNLADGKMSFENEPLSAVLEQMKLQYGVVFVLEKESISKCLFSGSLEDLNLEEACKLLELSLELRIEKQEPALLQVYGNGCDPPGMIN